MSNLAVSRRGVIDLFHVGQGEWKITGLRAGVVSLSEEGGEKNRYIITVLPLSEASSERHDSPCTKIDGLSGIRCSPSSNTLTGIATSIKEYLAALKVCAQTRCNFEIELDEDLSDEWNTYLKKILPRGGEVHSSSPRKILIPCGKETVPERIKNLSDLIMDLNFTGVYKIMCIEQFYNWRYKLSLKLIRLNSEDAEQKGIEALISKKPIALMDTQPNVLGSITLRSAKTQSSLMSEPILRLALQKDVKFKSGGEMPTFQKNGDELVWHEFGLSGVVSVNLIDLEFYEFSYDLNLKSPGRDGTLDVNKIASTLPIKLEKPTILGILDLKGEKTEESTLSFVGKIPILGPLLTKSKEETSKTRILIWADLRYDSDNLSNELTECVDNCS